MQVRDVVIHPRMDAEGLFIRGQGKPAGETRVEFGSLDELERYFHDVLERPCTAFLDSVQERRRGDAGPSSNARTGALLPIDTDPFCTTFYEDADYQGESFELCNWLQSIDYQARLGTIAFDDEISSIQVGQAIACVLCTQYSWFRGQRLWLIGGQYASTSNLAAVSFADDGTWNDRISSALSATVSPTQVLSWLIGVFL